MKRIILFVLAFSIFWFVSATWNIWSENSIEEQLDMSKVNQNSINGVSIKFCNDWLDKVVDRLQFSTRPWKKQEICVVMVNNSEEPVTVISSFVTASASNNGNPVCSTIWFTGDDIKIDLADMSTWIVLWAKETVVKKIYVGFAKNYSGNTYACLAIQSPVVQKAWNWSIFNLVVRKASPLLMIVAGEPYNYQRFDDIIMLIKNNLNTLYKILIWVFAILIVYNIFGISKKDNKETNHNNKK